LHEDNDIKPAKIWINIQRVLPQTAGEMAPIVQSYVDIILRGYLTISEELAHEFISTRTKGWHPSELIVGASGCHETDAETTDDEFDENEVVWVDDRLDPIYMRADPEYSLFEHGNKLDKILKHHMPELKNRRRRHRRRRRTTRSSSINR
jgi:hypothetical protein